LVQEGTRCDPENLPDPEAYEGFTCQYEKSEKSVIPSKFTNAYKGEVILSRSGNGIIAKLMQNVDPAQRYSHSGIMTKNYVEITHSTASEDRLTNEKSYQGSITVSVVAGPIVVIVDSISAPTDGLQPDRIKYAWPGKITQRVSAAIGDRTAYELEDTWNLFDSQDPVLVGLDAYDPDADKYSLDSFNPNYSGPDVDGDWEVVPPLVVKTDPFKLTDEIIDKSKEVAKFARIQRSHYRLFCYTDPTIANTKAPEEAGWAKDTFPSVCSSFIWYCMKSLGVQLEGPGQITTDSDLEQIPDRSPGKTEVNSNTNDGLYLYQEEERRNAGQVLFDTIHNMVTTVIENKLDYIESYTNFPIASGVFEALSDAADDTANQVLNTFASDHSDTEYKDSEEWKYPGTANAVSPDNILFWDPPEKQGMFGYFEPLIYRPAHVGPTEIWRWNKIDGDADLRGRTFYMDKPIGGVTVFVSDAPGMKVNSDDKGWYHIYNIQTKNNGKITIKANKILKGEESTFSDDVSLSNKKDPDIVTLFPTGPGLAIDHNIVLVPPPEFNRLIRIEIYAFTKEVDPPLAGAYYNYFNKIEEFRLYPTNRNATPDPYIIPLGEPDDLEGRLELKLIVTLKEDSSVEIHYDAILYEGSSFDTDDIDTQSGDTFSVPKDDARPSFLHLENPEFGSADAAEVQIFAKNMHNNL